MRQDPHPGRSEGPKPGIGAALAGLLRREWMLGVSLLTALAFLRAGPALTADLANPGWLAVIFTWLFAVCLGSSLSVVRHAEHLAVRLGEPFGTLILTLAVTFIEVASISAVMLHGENNPTLTRDTLFAVVMIVMNGMVGASLLLGGLRHKEQHYNLQGANAYLSVIVPLVVLSLVLPTYTETTAGPTLSGLQQSYLVFSALGLYATFLAIQSGRHRGYFSDGNAAHPADAEARPALPSAILLIAYLLPIVFLAEQLAVPVDYVVETLHAPAPLAGVFVAVLVATPEAIGATRAALANHLQHSVNVVLGSVLSTIGLTIPAMLVISHLTGHEIALGVEHADLVLLLLTLAGSILTFASGRTNVMQGAVHLILFGTYLLLIFQA